MPVDGDRNPCFQAARPLHASSYFVDRIVGAAGKTASIPVSHDRFGMTNELRGLIS
jgi:hypothetical protein